MMAPDPELRRALDERMNTAVNGNPLQQIMKMLGQGLGMPQRGPAGDFTQVVPGGPLKKKIGLLEDWMTPIGEAMDQMGEQLGMGRAKSANDPELLRQKNDALMKAGGGPRQGGSLSNEELIKMIETLQGKPQGNQ